MKRIGIIYNPKRKEAVDFSQKLKGLLSRKNIQTWLCSAWEPAKAQKHVSGSDLIISVGGDGTILRAAKAIIPESIPLLGVNLGKLGFMSELREEEVTKKLTSILQGKGWIEERAILEARLYHHNKTFYALNDVFIGRRSSARLVSIECRLDNKELTTYRVDGIILATASGSTGYALAAGGPVLHPQSQDMVLQPVCPHLSFNKTLVLPPQTTVELKILTTHEGMLSMDGQIEEPLNNGDKIIVKLSHYTTHFVRIQPDNYFYQTLEEKFNRKIA
jgi:NAD+ kinase